MFFQFVFLLNISFHAERTQILMKFKSGKKMQWMGKWYTFVMSLLKTCWETNKIYEFFRILHSSWFTVQSRKMSLSGEKLINCTYKNTTKEIVSWLLRNIKLTEINGYILIFCHEIKITHCKSRNISVV